MISDHQKSLIRSHHRVMPTRSRRKRSDKLRGAVASPEAVGREPRSIGRDGGLRCVPPRMVAFVLWPTNTLYYGDNLDVLRRYVEDESVDLVYLDPPFNSNATYNVLFAEQDGTQAAAQIQAFEDTWHWDQEAERAYSRLVEAGGEVAERAAWRSARSSASRT